MLKKRVISGILMAILMAVIFLADQFWFIIILLAVGVVGCVEILLANKGWNHSDRWLNKVLFIMIPVEYLFFTLFLASELRWRHDGHWFLLAIASTAAYDTMAFFIGRTFGTHKITPVISPKKTWEGTFGGFIGSIPVAIIIGYYFLSFGIWTGVILGVIIGILAFFGDLSVSWYKRQLGIKDMGRLIPGHGGLLDRLDSHLLVMWGVFFFVIFTA